MWTTGLLCMGRWIWSEGTSICEEQLSFFLFGYTAYCLLYPMHWVAAFHQMFTKIVNLFISFISGMGFREHSVTSITLSTVTQQKLWHGHCKRKSDSQKDIYQLSSFYLLCTLHLTLLCSFVTLSGWESESELQKALKHWVNLMMLWHSKYQNIQIMLVLYNRKQQF